MPNRFRGAAVTAQRREFNRLMGPRPPHLATIPFESLTNKKMSGQIYGPLATFSVKRIAALREGNANKSTEAMEALKNFARVHRDLLTKLVRGKPLTPATVARNIKPRDDIERMKAKRRPRELRAIANQVRRARKFLGAE